MPSISQVLKGLWLLIFVCIGVVIQLERMHWWDVRSVLVEGELSHVSSQAVQQRISPLLVSPLWRLDLHSLEEKVRTLVWLEAVDIHRRWPHTLVVQLHERQPVATFNRKGIVDNRDRLFFTQQPIDDSLPRLIGREQDFAELLQHWKKMSKILRSVGLEIVEISQQRYAVEILLKQGATVVLPRQQAVARLKRFVDSYPRLVERGEPRSLVRVDMRYRHGMAVQWADKAGLG